MAVEIWESFTSYDDGDRTNTGNFAGSVIDLPNGSALLAWTQEFDGGGETDEYNRIAGLTTADGSTFSALSVLADTPDVGDLNVCFLRDGSRVYMFWDVMAGSTEEDVWFRYTDDSAATWSTPALFVSDRGLRSNGIVMSNGERLLPVYAGADRTYNIKLMRCPAGLDASVPANWTLCVGPSSGTVQLTETAVCEIPGNKVLLLIRDDAGDYLWRCVFDNTAQTFGPITVTSMASYSAPASLLRFPNGIIQLIRDDFTSTMPQRTPLVRQLSYDGGVTFGPELVLVPSPGYAAYPTSCLLGDGTFAVWNTDATNIWGTTLDAGLPVSASFDLADVFPQPAAGTVSDADSGAGAGSLATSSAGTVSDQDAAIGNAAEVAADSGKTSDADAAVGSAITVVAGAPPLASGAAADTDAASGGATTTGPGAGQAADVDMATGAAALVGASTGAVSDADAVIAEAEAVVDAAYFDLADIFAAAILTAGGAVGDADGASGVAGAVAGAGGSVSDGDGAQGSASDGDSAQGSASDGRSARGATTTGVSKPSATGGGKSRPGSVTKGSSTWSW